MDALGQLLDTQAKTGTPSADPLAQMLASVANGNGAALAGGGTTTTPEKKSVVEDPESAQSLLNAVPSGMASGAANMLMTGAEGAAKVANKLGVMSDDYYKQVSGGLDAFRNLAREDVDNKGLMSQVLHGAGQTAPAVAATVAASPMVAEAAGKALAPQVAKFLAGSGAARDVGGKLAPGIANRLTNYASLGTAGALQSAAGNALNPMGSNADLMTRAKEGAQAGGGLGILLPAASDTLAATVSKFSGPAVDPVKASLAKLAENKFGINTPAYQLSESKLIQRAGSMLDRMGFTKKNLNYQKATEAIAREMGVDGATALTPEVMSHAREQTGNMYNEVLDSIGTVNAKDLDTKLAKIIDAEIDPNNLAPLRNLANKVLNAVEEGDVISARVLKDMIKKNSTLDRATKNPLYGQQAQEIEDALRSLIKASGSKEDVAKLALADKQWKTMRTVEGLAAKAGITGEIDPAKLLAPVMKSYKDKAYTGAGTLGELADIFNTFKMTPSSGTAENYLTTQLLPLLGTTGTAGGLLAASEPKLAAAVAAGAVGKYALGKVAGSALSSDWYRNRLIQAATKGQNPLALEFGGVQKLLPASIIGANKILERQAP